MATKTLLTVEDFMRLPDSVGTRDVRYELVEGELFELPLCMFEHNRVRDNVLMALMGHVKNRGTGTVVALRHFRLYGNTVRRADVSFVHAGRQLPPDGLPEGAPDLAAEVLAPVDAWREIGQRISDYFAAGCKRVWVFHPEHQEVYIHGMAGVTRKRADEMLEDADLLPGFSVKVSEFFA